MVETLLDSLQKVDPEKTSKIAELVKQLIDKRDAVEKAENEVKRLKAEADSISSERIPNLMSEMGIELLKTPFGKIEVIQKYRGYISKANEKEAFEWLRKNNHGDIIKTNVSGSFGMGEDDKAQQMLATLRSQGIDPIHKEGVHHAALSSWVKEMTEKGIDIPDDLFGVFIANETKIT